MRQHETETAKNLGFFSTTDMKWKTTNHLIGMWFILICFIVCKTTVELDFSCYGWVAKLNEFQLFCALRDLCLYASSTEDHISCVLSVTAG